MPDIISNTSGKTFVTGSRTTAYSADSAEAQNNATIIYNMLNQLGWSKLAVAALFGNIQNESAFNPNRYETGGGGFGLVQWTPKSNCTDIMNVVYPEGYTDSDGVQQVNVLIAEYEQTNYAQGNADGVNRGVNRQWYNSNGSKYGFSLTALDWYDWAHNETESLENMVKLFMVSYERPAYSASVNHWQRRVESAKTWLEWIGGVDPGGDGRFFPSTSSGDIDTEEVPTVSSKEIIKAVQAILKACGYYTGEIDGIMGAKTRAGLKKVGLV